MAGVDTKGARYLWTLRGHGICGHYSRYLITVHANVCFRDCKYSSGNATNQHTPFETDTGIQCCEARRRIPQRPPHTSPVPYIIIYSQTGSCLQHTGRGQMACACACSLTPCACNTLCATKRVPAVGRRVPATHCAWAVGKHVCLQSRVVCLQHTMCGQFAHVN